MGTNSKIEFSPGTLFIKHHDDGPWLEFAKVEDVEFECPVVDTDTVYIRKAADNMEFSVTMRLSLLQRIKLFGFWAVMKATLLRRNRNESR